MVNVLSTLNINDEIFRKDYVAPPVQKKKPLEKVIDVEEDLMVGLPVKAKQKRVRRTKLEIVKDAKKRQKEIRKDEIKKLIIGEYQMALKNKKRRVNL